MLLVIAVTVLGWWRPALFEVKRATPRWLWVGPIFMSVGALAVLVAKDTSKTTSAMPWLLDKGVRTPQTGVEVPVSAATAGSATRGSGGGRGRRTGAGRRWPAYTGAGDVDLEAALAPASRR